MAEQNNGSDQVEGRRVARLQACDPCKNKEVTTDAELYCKQCEEFQCKNCSKCHDIFKFMRGHEIVCVEQTPPARPKVDMKGLDKCTKHMKQFEFYCVGENMLCCSHCLLECNRNGCKEINLLTEEATRIKADIANVQSDLTELKVCVNKLIRFLKETKHSVGGELEQLLEQIENIKQAFVKKCGDMKTSVMEKVKTDKLKTTDEIEEKLADARTVIGKIAEFETIVTTVFENGSEEQKFIVECVVKQQSAQHLTDIRRKTNSIYRPVLSFKRNMLGETLQFVDNQVLPHSSMVHVDTATLVDLELITSVEVKQCEGETSKPWYTGMDFLPDGRLVVLDYENYKLLVMNGHLQKLGERKFNYRPCSVAVVSEKEVAVTCEDATFIQFVRVTKSNEITLAKRLNISGIYDSLCLMNESTFLVSTHENERPLRMITLVGEEKNFDNIPAKQCDWDNSRSTYIPYRDILVLTDKIDNTVHLFDNKTSGTEICVVKHESIKEPIDVCVGPDDSLFICSAGTNSLVQVSPSGRVLGSHKLEMDSPYTVCMSKDGKTLALSNYADNSELQLFSVKIK